MITAVIDRNLLQSTNMQRGDDLRTVISKYRNHPQLLGIEVGDDPNQRGAMRDTLLHFAAEAGDVLDIAILVAAGADINARGDIGNTPLHSAALMGNAAAIRRLI